MIEGLFFVAELLLMLLLLLKIIKPFQNDENADLGIFDYIKERPQAPEVKRGSSPRA